MTDAYTRILLTVLTLLVAVGVAHELGRPAGGAAATAGQRFTVVAIRAPGGPALIRTDTQTGEVWKRSFRSDEEGWVRLAEEPVPKPESSAATGGGEEGEPGKAGRTPARPLTEKDIQGFLELLRDDDPDARAYAARELGKGDANRAVVPLSQALQDPEPKVVAAAVGALRKIGDPAALPALRKLSQHPDPDVREAAAAAVEAIGR